MKYKKHIMSFKNYKKFKNRFINLKIKAWLDDYLPNSFKPNLPQNPDETVPSPE